MLSLLCAFAFSSADTVKAAVKSVMVLRGYELDYDHSANSNEFNLFYRRKSGGQGISLQGSRAKHVREVDEWKEGQLHGSAVDAKEQSPSGVQLGDVSFVFDDGMVVRAATKGFIVDIGYAEVPPKDARMVTRTIEATARLTLAELIGSTLNADYKPTAPNSSEFERLQGGYVALPTLVKLNSIETSFNDVADRCMVRFKDRRYEFALASSQLAVDGRVGSMSTPVARKDGVWLFGGESMSALGFRIK